MPGIVTPALGLAGAGALAAPSVKLSQAEALQLSIRARRVRVGNLPTDPALVMGFKDFVNALLPALKLTVRDGECVLNVALENLATGVSTAIVELRTVREAQNARQNLAGLKYGDSALTVEWPADYAPLSDSEVRILMNTGVLGVDGDVPPVIKAASASEPGPKPKEEDATQVVCLENLLSKEELDNDEDAKDCLDDTRDKCESDFGAVEDAVLVRPMHAGAETYVGKVMVKFKDAAIAFKAATSLHGLRFDGRPVGCTFVTVEQYDEVAAIVKSPADAAPPPSAA